MKHECELCGIDNRLLTKVRLIYSLLRDALLCDTCLYKCQVIGITEGTSSEGATRKQEGFVASVEEYRRTYGVPIQA